MTLHDKRKCIDGVFDIYMYPEKDVKEALKKILKTKRYELGTYVVDVSAIIREFGEGLIHSPTNARESSQAFDNEISKGVKPLSDNIQNSEDKNEND